MTDRKNWIGRIKLPNGDVATLGNDGRWSCNDIDVQRYLDLFFDPRRMPDLGLPAGRSAVARAAAALGGKTEFPFKLQPLREGELS